MGEQDRAAPCCLHEEGIGLHAPINRRLMDARDAVDRLRNGSVSRLDDAVANGCRCVVQRESEGGLGRIGCSGTADKKTELEQWLREWSLSFIFCVLFFLR